MTSCFTTVFNMWLFKAEFINVVHLSLSHWYFIPPHYSIIWCADRLIPYNSNYIFLIDTLIVYTILYQHSDSSLCQSNSLIHHGLIATCYLLLLVLFFNFSILRQSCHSWFLMPSVWRFTNLTAMDWQL